MHDIRTQLGDGVIENRGDEELRLAPAVQSDVAQFEEASEKGQLAKALELYRGELLPGFHGSAAPEFDRFVETVANANKAFVGAVLNRAFDPDLRPELPKITAPTLIIRGEHDAARTRAHVEELLAGIPGSTAVEIAGAGHSPQVDSPEAFSRALRGFLLN